VNVGVDQSRKHRQAAPIDACRASWNRDRATRAGGGNLTVADDDGCRFDGLSGSVDQPDVVYGDGHVVSASDWKRNDDATHHVVELEVSAGAVGMPIMAIDAGLGDRAVGIHGLKETKFAPAHNAVMGL